MKKLLMFILAAFLFLGIAACDGVDTDLTTDAPTQETTETPTTVEPTTEEPTTVEVTTYN